MQSIPNVETFMHDEQETDITKMFKGYANINIPETYGTFWLIKQGVDHTIKLERRHQYELKSITQTGHHKPEESKSILTFQYFFQNKIKGAMYET